MAKLIVGIKGITLTADESHYLQDPRIAGVILFARNYQNRAQLVELVQSIRQTRADLLISVDHEGGRVQRFRSEFTVLPSASRLAQLYRHNTEQALSVAKACGSLMAHELQACDIDFSYAPVLDLDYSVSAIIGDRSYGRDPLQVTALAGALMQGLTDNGMAAVGKHYPGHGGVAADTHGEIVIDHRSREEMNDDFLVFELLIAQGLAAIMPAHIIYPKLDADYPAGFSKILLQDILRQELGFDGAIISDDLGMAGASAVGDLKQQLNLATAAGCDLLLLCNDFASIVAALKIIPDIIDIACDERIKNLRRQGPQKIKDFDNTNATYWREQLAIL